MGRVDAIDAWSRKLGAHRPPQNWGQTHRTKRQLNQPNFIRMSDDSGSRATGVREWRGFLSGGGPAGGGGPRRRVGTGGGGERSQPPPAPSTPSAGAWWATLWFSARWS